ncbi:hypothetical protein HJA87_31115 [Rhizobium bangladeshense]|uniref:Helix-turn-helix domain-containing protein n=1 Tax=Rhizobium bangladeshense TaxID=1138189 RepID=A0ABS7LSK0_9HYPH|nr:hypothetical protein [Rhizobium bangladeshense]MBY3594253.1 hypothetical protein [Rhizobium bangladeshense]
MTKPLDEHSPHYSIKQKRICRVLNLVCQLSRCDDPKALVRAHKAVQWLAKQDADHATLANGLGFRNPTAYRAEISRNGRPREGDRIIDTWPDGRPTGKKIPSTVAARIPCRQPEAG